MSVLRCLLTCQPADPSQFKCDLICQLVRPNRSWRVRITLSTVFFPMGQVQPYQPNEVFHVFPELELIESLRVSDTNFGWQRFSFMEAFPEAKKIGSFGSHPFHPPSLATSLEQWINFLPTRTMVDIHWDILRAFCVQKGVPKGPSRWVHILYIFVLLC